MKSIKRTLALTLVFCMMLAFVPTAVAAGEPALTATSTGGSHIVKYYGAPDNQYQVFVNADNLSGTNKNSLDLSLEGSDWTYTAASGYETYGCTVTDGTVILSSDTKSDSTKSFKVTASNGTVSYLINIIVNAQFNVNVTGNGSVKVNSDNLGTTGGTCYEDLGTVTFTLTPGTGKNIVSLTITPSGGTPITYLGNAAASVQLNGITSTTYTVSAVFESDVIPAITITTQPSSKSVVLGNSATLSVVAGTTGTAALTYQWQSCSTATGNYADITGATSASLTVTPTATGTTYYKCVVSATDAASVTSSYAYVTATSSSSTTMIVRTTTSSPSSSTSSISSLDLGTASSTGYTASSYASYFYIHNTGSTALTGVKVSVSGSNFEIVSGSSISSVSGGGYGTVRIRPTSGLTTKKEYSATVTITADNATTRTFTVYFTLGKSSSSENIHVATTSSTSSNKAIDEYTFTSKAAGYDDLDPVTFYIHNDSDSTITSVSVSLSSKTNFTLDTSDTDTSVKSGKSTTFTVTPKTGLKAGTYTATVTVSNKNDDDYELELTFVVKSSGSNSDLYFTEKKNGSSFSKLSFETVNEGYSAISAQTVYLYNDSGSSLKTVSVALSGTDKSSFTLSTTSLGTISDGSYATFTIVPKTGLAAGSYTAKVTAEASNGTNSSFTVNFTVKANSTTTTTTTTTPKYNDVATNAWYYNDVIRASEVGLIDGFADGTFKPDNNLTIAQTIKLAACMHQLYYNGTVTLTNGSPNWYDSYVTYALNNGIISGIYPDYLAVITREEFVNIMYNSRPSSDYAILSDLAADYIPDVRSGDTYYSKIFRFYQAGILTGSDTAGTFNPKSNIKRSEVAAILIRVYDKTERIG